MEGGAHRNLSSSTRVLGLPGEHRPALGEKQRARSCLPYIYAHCLGFGENLGLRKVGSLSFSQVDGVGAFTVSPKQGSCDRIFLPTRDVVSPRASSSVSEGRYSPEQGQCVEICIARTCFGPRISRAATLRAAAGQRLLGVALASPVGFDPPNHFAAIVAKTKKTSRIARSCEFEWWRLGGSNP